MSEIDELAVSLPDIFGHVTFCDDIRVEASNKLIAIGIYLGRMNVFSGFPAQLRSFAMLIEYRERFETRTAPLTIEVFFPGMEKPVFQAEVESEQFRRSQMCPGKKTRPPTEAAFPWPRPSMRSTEVVGTQGYGPDTARLHERPI